jgi:DNA mismatch repair protein MutS2
LDLNNRLVELTTSEDTEVHRILRHMTLEIWQLQEPIRHIADVLAEVDYVLARGRLSQILRCTEPEFSEDGGMIFIQARHPLLVEAKQGEDDTIVPATLAVDATTQTLVITGPNTGGKTVLLKTIGLLTLMAQAGMHIPSAEGSKLDICSISSASCMRPMTNRSCSWMSWGLVPILLRGLLWELLSWNISLVKGLKLL